MFRRSITLVLIAAAVLWAVMASSPASRSLIGFAFEEASVVDYDSDETEQNRAHVGIADVQLRYTLIPRLWGGECCNLICVCSAVIAEGIPRGPPKV